MQLFKLKEKKKFKPTNWMLLFFNSQILSRMRLLRIDRLYRKHSINYGRLTVNFDENTKVFLDLNEIKRSHLGLVEDGQLNQLGIHALHL